VVIIRTKEASKSGISREAIAVKLLTSHGWWSTRRATRGGGRQYDEREIIHTKEASKSGISREAIAVKLLTSRGWWSTRRATRGGGRQYDERESRCGGDNTGDNAGDNTGGRRLLAAAPDTDNGAWYQQGG
jgi:hypothetical protein